MPQIAIVLGAVRFGHENRDILADEVLSRVPKEPLARGVYGLDQAHLGDRNNPLVDVL